MTVGELTRQADEDNRRRLVAAFPDYFECYTTLARRKEAELESPDLAGRKDGPT